MDKDNKVSPGIGESSVTMKQNYNYINNNGP